MTPSETEQITEPCAYHGASPVWWFNDELRFLDTVAGDVISVDTSSGDVVRTHVGPVAAALRARVGGGFVVALERGFAVSDKDGRMEYLGDLWSDPGIHFGEGACDPYGNFYCGTIGGNGNLYRLGYDVSIATDEVSGGLVWSEDKETAYYIDTPSHRVDAFDYSRSSGLTNRRVAFRIPPEHGEPRGMTIDHDGYLWIAMWGNGTIRRYTVDGRLDGRLDLPVQQITGCTFGGEYLNDLYITTSRAGLANSEPQAGALFRVRVGVTGLIEPGFDH